MLKELLQTIYKEDYVSKGALAERLDRPLQLIEAGLEELIKMGYLREAGQIVEDNPSCAKCPYASLCNKNPLRMLAITEKGRNFLRQRN